MGFILTFPRESCPILEVPIFKNKLFIVHLSLNLNQTSQTYFKNIYIWKM